MKRLIIVRLLFGGLIAGIAILSFPTFFFVCDVSSDDSACAQSEHAMLVFEAMLWLFLPATLVLAVGWWRSEMSIKGVTADRTIPLKWFRLAMAVGLFASLVMILSPFTVGGVALPFLVATVVAWVVVESVQENAKDP